MNKTYHIFLDSKKIGTTLLEKGDPPMGVVFGQIHFLNIESPYNYFKAYCSRNEIEVTDHPTDRLISTRTIDNLKVFDDKGIEIVGLGNHISGMDLDSYEITIEGIAYPFYCQEFATHVKEYGESFK